ncbi:MAG: protein kinase domain-containing protein, partial [Nannocystaceae bacterium]
MTDVGRRVGRYQLLDPIGAGGMGTVYRGHRIGHPERPVAIKMIAAEHHTRARALKREFRLMSEFRHPNVVRIYDLHADE